MIDYSRQNTIKGLRRPDAVSVIGAGGLGTWVSYLCAIMGVPHIRIFTPELPVRDFDAARFPFKLIFLGAPRGNALKDTIVSVRPDCDVDIRPKFVVPTSLAQLIGIVFNCASDHDDFDRNIWTYCKDSGLKYVTGGYSGASGGVSVSPQIVVPPTLEPVPVWAAGLAGTASMMLHAAMINQFEFFGPLDTLHMEGNTLQKNVHLLGQGIAR